MIQGLDRQTELVANAIMMAFIKKWFLGSYKGPVYVDCVNGEMAWLEETKAAMAALDKYRAKQSGPVMSELADKLERLCCAETETEFFNTVTDSIQEIVNTLRAYPQIEAERDRWKLQAQHEADVAQAEIDGRAHLVSQIENTIREHRLDGIPKIAKEIAALL